MSTHLRHSVRALIVDERDRVLLCRFRLDREGTDLWTTPGGGVEVGETLLQALSRELDEEVGLVLEVLPPWIWHQVLVDPTHSAGYDGVVNDTYLVRVESFHASGSLGAEMLRAEGIEDIRWWNADELFGYEGPAVFGPRDLPTRVGSVYEYGVPAGPIDIGA